MSSSSEKGKSGGKKLSANKQLLVLQDALTSGVSELQLAAWRLGDQKIYLLEALKPGVVRALDMRGVDNSLMDKLFEEVRRKVLGYNHLNLILDDWQRVFQKEEERVVDFKVRVCTYLRALGINVVRKLEDQKQIIAELRKKFRKTLVEVFEGGGRNI